MGVEEEAAREHCRAEERCVEQNQGGLKREEKEKNTERILIYTQHNIILKLDFSQYGPNYISQRMHNMAFCFLLVFRAIKKWGKTMAGGVGRLGHLPPAISFLK